VCINNIYLEFKLTTLAESYGQIKSQEENCIVSNHSYVVARFGKLAERENIRGPEISRKPSKHATLVPLRSLSIKVKCIDSHSFASKIVALMEQNSRNLTQRRYFSRQHVLGEGSFMSCKE